MFVAGAMTKRKGFSSVLILSKKNTNQHRTLHLNPQRAGFMVKPNITAKSNYLNFHPLEVVSRYRDPQLQVGEIRDYTFANLDV